MNMFNLNNENRNKCTGCNMCEDLCPFKAISFSEDDEGFRYPVVDYEKCTNCGLCERKCPVMNEISTKNHSPQIYAAWSVDDSVRMKSTSGGVFYELALSVLNNNGIVVGATYSSDWKSAYHILIDSSEHLDKIVGSKYFQSNLQGVYTKIKDCLIHHRKVLFCGTPCQSYALQKFVEDKELLLNLYTVDFICLGINSPLAFREFLHELENDYHSKVDYVQLKNKRKGWKSLSTYIHFANGDEYLKTVEDCKWIKGYIMNGGMFMRPSCYECMFRNIPRISDISLGDFWGITNCSDIDNEKGVSAVMINSEKGDALFDSVKSRLHFERRNINELSAGNPAIFTSPVYTNKRKEFFNSLKAYGFSRSVDLLSDNKEKNNKKIFDWMNKIILRLYHLKCIFIKSRNISITRFIEYNYFKKNIIREKGIYIIPYKGAILDIDRSARLYVSGRNIEIGINKLRGSKAETHVRLWRNSVWHSHNGCDLFYNTVLEVCENASLNSGYFSANGGSVIVCAKEIVIGEDVMLGRNVFVYDSDHHQVYDNNLKMCNYPQKVEIKDHVWLTSNIVVQKGVTIGRDSIVGSFTTVTKSVDEFSFVSGKSKGERNFEVYGWSRDSSNGI